jgi:hypothetical protein
MMSAVLAAAAVALVPVHSVSSAGGRWSLVTPEGKPWWSMGVCCTNPGATWDNFQPSNPGYAGHRLFPTSKDWVADTQNRLRSWNFNSLAGWSEVDLFQKHGGDQRLPYFVVLHLGAYYRAPWDDMFSKEFEAAASKAAKDQIEKLRDDPYLVGYFTDNELGWWDDTLFSHYLAMPPKAPGRRRLISVLKNVYKGSFTELKKDWKTSLNTFEELEKGGDLKLLPGSKGMRAVNAWTKEIATHYYSSVRRMVKKHDSKRLILGDRYAQFWELPIIESAKPYVDVISTNYGADWFDGSLSRYFLDTLHAVTGKPVMIGEFYMNAMQNQSGNGNSIKAFPIVETQEERASGTAKYLQELAARPYVVGAHWFQFYDHPPQGRAGDKEDNNMGLVDTLGRPYPLLVDVFAKFNWTDVPPTKAVECQVIPSWTPKHAEGLRDWPRLQGWVKSNETAAFGDLYLAQEPDALWVGAVCSDYMDERIYVGGRIPEEDRPHLSLALNGLSRPLEIRFAGKDRKAVSSLEGVEIREWPGLKHQLAIRIPWTLLGGRPAKLSLQGRMDQHSRAASMSWKTEVRVEP